MTKTFRDKTILITGNRLIRQNFIKHILKKLPFKKVIIFSRDELKQHEMKVSEDFNEVRNKQLRFFIGILETKID